MCHVRQKQKWHNLNLLCISSNAQDKLSIEPKFSAFCDEFHVIRSSLWSLTQILTVSVAHAANILTWKRVVDMTACADVKSQCKYSTKIKTESHPLIVRGCYLRHFVKPGLRYPSDMSSNKQFSHRAVPSYCKKNNFGFAGGWCWTLLPLAYNSACQMFAWRFLLDFLRGEKNSKSCLKDTDNTV